MMKLMLPVVPLLLCACTSSDPALPIEGVTSFAGNAIAANTAMQLVDPWPIESRDTHFRVPAERKAPAATAPTGATVVAAP